MKISKKVFLVSIPYIGHLNPLFAALSELKNSNAEIVVYSIRKFKDIIEQNNLGF
jgi:UDP:flavonoid glycosyltransferase YjiC (YdhE family)